MGSTNSRRGFLRKLGQSGAVVAAAVVAAPPVAAKLETPSAIATTPIAPPYPQVTWPCMKCAGENHTPSLIFETVKFNLRCAHCGWQQLYRWHIKKFDPAPTEYVDGSVVPVLMLTDQPSKLKKK